MHIPHFHHRPFPLLANSCPLLRDRLLRTALNFPSSWAVDVVVWDPALVISLLRQILVGDRWPISTDNRELLISWDGLLGTGEGTTGALTTLAAALALWEEGLDPSLIDEVESSGEGGEEDEVEEDAAI